MRQFFLQTVDEPSFLILSEVPCGTPSRDALRAIVEPDPEDEDIQETYLLERVQVDAIMQLCKIQLDLGQHQFQLASWDECDGLPYRLHAGRELPLMLSGAKPLSYLYGTIPPNEHFVEIPEYLFDPYVDIGRFVKRQRSLFREGWAMGMRQVLYALKEEAWRIDAFFLVQDTAHKTGWNEALTRMEGTLLGYEEWQNDAFIGRMKGSDRSEQETASP